MDNQSDHGIILGGISMGGLVTRSALLQLENQGYDHRVEAYYAFDSPNQGANVPLGYQHLVGFALAPVVNWVSIRSFLNTVNLNPLELLTKLQFMEWANSFIDQSAALQMAAQTYRVDPRRGELLSHFSSLGNYPDHVPKMIAISDGVNGATLDFGTNDELFKIDFLQWCPIDETIKIPFPASLVKSKVKIKWCPIDISMNANSSAGLLDEVLRLNATVKPVPLLPSTGISYVKRTKDRDLTKAQKDIANIDRAPGGTLNFGSELESLEGGSIDIFIPVEVEIINVRLPFIGRVQYTFRATIDVSINNPIDVSSQSNYEFSFVPMVSAFDIQSNTWLYDINSIPNFPYPQSDAITPFDVLIPHQEANGSHGYLEEPIVGSCMIDEMAPANLYLEARTYNSDYAYEGANIITGDAVDPNTQRQKSGDLVVSSGSSLTLTATESIVLRPGTEFEAGSNVSLNVVDPASVAWSYDDNGDCIFVNSAKTPDPTSRVASFPSSSIPGQEEEQINQSTEVEVVDSIQSNSENLEYELVMVVEGMNDDTKTSVSTQARYSLPSNSIDKNDFKFTVYPNPVENIANLMIMTGESGEAEITLFSANGQKIDLIKQDLKSGYNIVQLNVTQLQTGVYPVLIKQGRNRSKSKIVIGE